MAANAPGLRPTSATSPEASCVKAWARPGSAKPVRPSASMTTPPSVSAMRAALRRLTPGRFASARAPCLKAIAAPAKAAAPEKRPRRSIVLVAIETVEPQCDTNIAGKRLGNLGLRRLDRGARRIDARTTFRIGRRLAHIRRRCVDGLGGIGEQRFDFGPMRRRRDLHQRLGHALRR